MSFSLEIMDTTLRDGEQTSGVAFAIQEKASIARFLLTEVGVDRLEVASARVSSGEYEAVKQISIQKGYDAVIDRASATSIVFASPRIDISNEVLAKLGYSN